VVTKNFNNLGYLVSFFPGIFVIFGNLLGGFWTLGNIIFSMIFLVLLDWIVPEDESHPEETGDFFADSILVIHVVVNTIAIWTLLFSIHSGVISGIFILTAVLATGINSGMSGIIVAHECIHRKSNFFRFIGCWNLINVLYIHWYIEHKYGHHKWVGTFKDPATARYGENVYFFIARTIPQQFFSSIKIEWKRQKKKGRNPINPYNFMIRGFLMQFLYIGAIFSYFGVPILLLFIAQAIIAIILLEMVNYIEHYGLLREEKDQFEVDLAWNTNKISSRYFLLELVRHSDHHLKSYKPYQTLEAYPNVPTLPSGYWGMFYITLLPRYWRKIIHPLIPTDMKIKFFKLKGLPVPETLGNPS
jgi:alkane 1-monooxygenase